MSASLHRLISIAILLGWLAPGAGAFAIGLHLASDHHGPHGQDHEQELAKLVRAAAHGHHHDLESAPDHHHEARFDGQAPASRPDFGAGAVLPTISSSGTGLDQVESFARVLRRGPPRALFEVNCVLLI